MPTIEITYALADSEIDAAGFSARGTWTAAVPPPVINCLMRPSAGADIVAAGTVIDPRGFWRSDFPPLPAGQIFTLHADIPGGPLDDEPRVKVRGGGTRTMSIEPPPPLPPYPEDPSRKNERQDYRISGSYDPKSRGVAIICMAVTRDADKKIRSVDAVAHAELKNGKWVATLNITPVESKEKLTIVAVLIDGECQVIARVAHKTPAQE
jgi:hypothetical protein